MRPSSARSSSSRSGREKKDWIRISRSSMIFKVVDSLKDRKSSPVGIHDGVKLPMETEHWEVMLYQEISKSRYKFIVQYDYNPAQFCSLKMKIKKNKSECVGCHFPVKKPSEGGGKGGGFDKASFGVRGSADGKFKALAFLQSKKDPPKKLNYKTEKELKKDKDGFLIYSAAGTKEIEMRDYDVSAKRVSVDQTKYADYIVKQPGLRQKLKTEFERCVRDFGADEMIPSDKILDVVHKAGAKTTKFQQKRMNDFGRYDKDGYIKYDQFIKIINRTYNESESGKFHLTVKELQEMFNDADEDYSGELEAEEISKILEKVHLVEDENQVREYMKGIDKDGDQKMDFEEFMTLCQHLYKQQGGQVVANRSGPVQFNQTRGIIDKLREKVERNHLMIVHLQAQLTNYDEQLEIMNTIAAHSAVQKELDQCQKDMTKMVRLKDDMTLSVRQWLHKIKMMHNKEKQQMLDRIAVVDGHREAMAQHKSKLIQEFEVNFDQQMGEVAPLIDKLQDVKGFIQQSIQETQEGAQNTAHQIDDEAGELRQANAGADDKAKAYDSSSKIHEFVLEKTQSLEEWLISHTKFMQNNKVKTLERVEQSKKKKEEFRKMLEKVRAKKKETEKSVQDHEKQLEAVRKKNADLRTIIEDPELRRQRREQAEKLKAEQESLQEEVNQLQRASMTLTQTVSEKSITLAAQREKIGQLDVELGELKVLLDGVKYDHDAGGGYGADF